MIVANEKRKKNIAEYLLYMWQVEDLIRANGFDIEKIRENILPQYEGSPEDKEAIARWYEELIDMMRSEGVKDKGHIQLLKNVLIDLTDLHLRLLRTPKETAYGAMYYQTLPYIVELRSKSGGEEVPELETCFTALYGYLLLRMQQKPVSEETQKAIRQISSFLALLSEKYRQEKNGELDLEEN